MGGKSKGSRGLLHKVSYRRVLDRLLEGCQIIGFDWKYLYVNDAAVKYAHCTKKELLGRTITTAYPGIEKTKAFSLLKECMRRRTCRLVEEDLALPDGTRGRFELRIQPVPEGIFILSHEVTERRKVEEALKESEERFRRMARASKDLVMLTDPEGTIVYLSPACKKVLGWDPESLLGSHPSIFHPEDKAKAEAALRGALHGKSKMNLEYRVITKDGKARWVSHSWFPVLVHGKVRVVSSVVQDITAQKFAEEALKKSEERLSGIFDNASNCIVVYTADEGGKDFIIADFNHAAERVEKAKKNDVVGKRVTSVFPGVKKFGILDIFRRVWKSGKPEHFPVKRYKDKRIAGWRENYIFKLDSGEIVAVYSDLTKEKQAEVALRESEEKYRTLVDQSLEGILLAREGPQIVFANPALAKILGYTIEELLALPPKKLTRIVHPEDREMFFRRFRQRLRGKVPPASYEFRAIRKDGKELWLTISSKRIMHLGHPAVQATFTDVTMHKILGDVLKESEEKFRVLVENSQDLIMVTQANGIISYLSPACKKVLGWDPESLLGTRPDIFYPEDAHRVQKTLESALKGKSGMNLEYRIVTKEGAVKWVSHSWSPVMLRGKLKVVSSTVRDITDRKQSEELLRKLNRTLLLLTDSNRLLVKAKDEQVLLQGICRILVKQGGYRMAWFGVAENDPKKSVRPVAHAGVEKGYLGNARFSWGRNKWGHGPTGTAIRSGKPCFVGDIPRDPKYLPWRAAANKRGYASLISLPLVAEGKSIGALNIYSGVPNAFNKEEIALLEQLAEDIAYGLVARRTEEKRIKAVHDLKTSEKKFRRLFEAAKDGILIVDAKTGKITDSNPFLEKLMGYKKKELLGKKAWEVSMLHDVITSRNRFRELVRKKYVRYEDLPLRAKDGTEKAVEFVSNVYAVNGDRVIQSNIRDITLRKNALDALHESEEKYRRLTENMNDVIYSMDLNGVLTYMSPSAKQYGVDPQKMVLHHFQEFIFPADVERTMGEFQRSFKTGKSFSTEFRIIGKRGRIYWIEDNGKFQYDESGKPISLTGTLRDVTERKKFEELKKEYTLKLESKVRARTKDLLEQKRKAEALTEMKDRFVRDIGHELKTPLSVILGDLALLKEIAPAGKEREWSKLLDMLDRSATRLESSINRMLQLYKITQVEAKKERVYLKEALTNIYNEYLPLAKMKELEFRVESKPAVILGDGELIQIVLSNLVSNAIKFTNSGSVLVELKPSKKYVSISVSDTGKGISPGNQKKLFEKFFKVDPSAPGTGIGLKITKEIVEKHNGKLKVVSKLGQGSTFTIALPRGVEE